MKIGAKIRRLRKLKRLTLEEVAEGADLTKGFISQVERDIVAPSITNLKQVLDVLGVSLVSFFGDMEENERNIFARVDRIESASGEGYKIESLLPKLQYLEMEPVLLTISGGANYQGSFEDDEGFGFVIHGRVHVVVGSEERRLSRGGCFYVFFDNLLKIKNLGDKPAELLLVYY